MQPDLSFQVDVGKHFRESRASGSWAPMPECGIYVAASLPGASRN